MVKGQDLREIRFSKEDIKHLIEKERQIDIPIENLKCSKIGARVIVKGDEEWNVKIVNMKRSIMQ